MTEVWVRNPITCIRECAEVLFPRIAWDRGYYVKNKIDPQRHLELHYPTSVDYRLLLIGDQGAAELTRGTSIEQPKAVYPVWVYEDMMIPDLEEMMRTQQLPNGRAPDEIGVDGQEHMVVLTNFPHMRQAMGKALKRTLIELQDEYPNCRLYIHGLYGYKDMFMPGWHAVDIDATAQSRRGRVTLPSGRRMEWERTSGYSQWVSTLGFTVGQLASPQERTKFDIASAVWAGKNFNSDVQFRSRDGGDAVDWKSPDNEFQQATTKRVRTGSTPPAQPGDKLLCSQCSLAPTCKHFREGGVCIISDSDGAGLAKHFKTRDSEQIIEGLGRVLQVQSERFEQGRTSEKATNELDPEVTKIGNAIFQAGVKLAKLIDPTLNQPGVQVNVGIANHQQAAAAELANTPAQMMAAVVGELTEQGIPIDAITPEMVAEYLVAKHRKSINQMTAIEA